MIEDVPLAERPASVPANVTEPLILDLLVWLAPEPRTYAEVMEAWRTSCPRLTIWEDCVDRGFVVRERGDQRGAMVVLTELGRQRLGRVT